MENIKEDYVRTIQRPGVHETLYEWMNVDQFFSEEIGNYFDDSNKAQMESLLMLLNEAYALGRQNGLTAGQLHVHCEDK